MERAESFYARKKVQIDTNKNKDNLTVVVYGYAKKNYELTKNIFFKQLHIFITNLLAA